jgi:demethylmenaquinone methyltransferase/2-methoxy-6-polyprenyl-1,4-benzoquinol methylase
LETTRPRRSLIFPFIWFHMHVIIPLLGTLISGFHEAYTYLPDSTEGFLEAEDLATQMKEAGFKNVRFRYKMFHTVAIHYGEKGI